MDSQHIVFILDKIGIVAFSFGGVSLGVQKRVNILGLFFLGMINAVGGGILRDLILNKTPFAIANTDYLVFAGVASLISVVIFHYKLHVPTKVFLIADAIGLGAFAAAGAAIALHANLSILQTVIFAVITPVGGGIIVDVLRNEVPVVLREEMYASAAGLGGIASYLLVGLGISNAVLFGAIIAIFVRMFVIKKKLQLPVIE